MNKMRINQKNNLSFFFYFPMLLLLLAVQAQAGKGPYPEVAAQLCKEVVKIMVHGGVCASDNDCSKHDRVKWSGDLEHATISLYEAGTSNDDMVNDLVLLCMKTYNENQKIVEIKLKFYQVTHHDKMLSSFMGVFGGIKPFMEVIIKGENRL